MIDPIALPGNEMLARLRDEGFAADDLVRIAVSAAQVDDLNRKPLGAANGALGMSGCSLYEAICRSEGYEPFYEPFERHVPFTATAMAGRLRMTQGTIGGALRRLVEHGFADRRRDGRSFSIRLHVPAVALRELAQDWTENDYNRGSMLRDDVRAIAAVIMARLPA